MASKAADNVKPGTKGAATISGDADDFIASFVAPAKASAANGKNGGDIINGTGGNDTINTGAGNDQVSGGGGNDKINAGGGNDIVDGGAGDDVLNAGGGSDTYRFHFAVSGGATETHTFVFDPSGDLQTQYITWLWSIGADTNGDSSIEVQWDPQGNPTDPLKFLEGATTNDSTIESVKLPAGRGFATYYYENRVTTAGTGEPAVITSSDGHDTIVQFQNAGQNVDTIELEGLAGLTDEELSALFDLTTIDTNGDQVADSTLLSWDGGSIKILGSTAWANELAFFHDPHVLLV